MNTNRTPSRVASFLHDDAPIEQLAPITFAGFKRPFHQTLVRSPLGTVCGALLRAINAWYEDPISEHYGIYPSPASMLQGVARAHAWSVAEIEHELEARGVSAHWLYHSGMTQVLGEAVPDKRQPLRGGAR
jgi:hypothetical protein